MSQMNSSTDAPASRRVKTASTDLLDLLAAGEPPAFASDSDHRIIFWNKGAEQIMGRTAAQTLGRYCHDVFCGRDSFGNRFCAEICAVTTALTLKERVRRFEVDAGDRRVPHTLGFTIIEYPDAKSGKKLAVHLMDSVKLKGPLVEVIERIGARRVDDVPTDRRPSLAAEDRATASGEVSELSQREREVLRSVAEGMANKEIAKALHISVATTRNHIQHILQKLNVHSKLEAIALAFNRGWV